MAEYISFQPSDHNNTKLYTGNGTTDTAITGVGFQPDFTWIKQRDGTYFHNCYDSVRGVQEVLVPNGTDVEYNDDETLLAFGADGFTIGLRTNVNNSSSTYVAWNWKAGTTTGIAGSPSITPTSYSFNATAGFSIIEYTGNGTSGATLPHGLGAVPELIIIKNRDQVMDWVSYHAPLGNTKYMVLNTTGAAATSTTRWNDTTPGATLFTIGDTDKLNSNTVDYIAYVWTPKKGYSKFGSYIGNGNADGPFVYTGFRPSWVLLKSSDNAEAWTIQDDKRLGYNPDNRTLRPANTSAENTSSFYMDFVSNGFKIRNTNTEAGASGYNYIYAAFAEFPLVSSNDVPGVAR